MITVQNIIDYIEDNWTSNDKEDAMYGYITDIPGVAAELVDRLGGEEQGEEFYTVLEFRNEETDDTIGYIKFEGWFASYHGAWFDRMFEVKPFQKTITAYE